MRFYDIDDDREVSLEQVADALRPYLQPAPTDAPALPAVDWRRAPDWAQWHAVDVTGQAFWYSECPVRATTVWKAQTLLGPHYMSESPFGSNDRPCLNWADTLAQRPQPAQPVNEQVQALDAAKQRAELQLADAQQEIAAARRLIDEADIRHEQMAAELVELRQANAALLKSNGDAWRSRDAWRELAQQSAPARVAQLEALLAEATDRWAAIPWQALSERMLLSLSTGDSIAVQWYRANCPPSATWVSK